MKRSFKITIIFLVLIALIAVSALLVMTSDVPVLDPKGIIAQQEKDLLITTFLLMVIVMIPVFVFTLMFAYHYREKNLAARYEPTWEHNNLAEYFWWGVPICIIFVLSIITWKTTHDLDPFKPLDDGKPPVAIQVVALQWKWLFIYPEEGIATVNYIQFPEKRPINFTLTGDAPMNSFWIPRLGGQIYAMPGMQSKLYLMAKQPGEFRGSSAHISGEGFAGMVFTAKASSEEDYLSWIETTRSEGSLLTFSEYLELAKPSENVPAQYYTVESDLFAQILEQYQRPEVE
ncbi:MAG: ubiquinol oxidase subunit II [Chlamydiota bacterium]